MTHKLYKILLLENINPKVKEELQAGGFEVEALSQALGEKELIEKLKGVHVLGIRSKTQVTRAVLSQSPELLFIGCFCIGTNQVDLEMAELCGIPVFNAPFSNTRSVAEMVIAEIIMLSRQLGDRVRELHEGIWKKTATNCFEVRGKTLGIVGYGHIGSQVGVMAEFLGMSVLYYDIVPKMSHGNTQPCESLNLLLKQSDFVTLHVPETPQTRNLIQAEQIAHMKRGSYLINASRGTVVQVSAVTEALKSGHLAGAALDVYPEEPEANTNQFQCELQKISNVILTPHIGGSTQEAQVNIGREVLNSLLKFVREGSTTSAVNFPQVDVPLIPGTFRILNIHKNVPGVLKDINRIISDLNANIHNQVLSTNPRIGYLVTDIDQDVSQRVLDALTNLKTSIRTRIVEG